MMVTREEIREAEVVIHKLIEREYGLPNAHKDADFNQGLGDGFILALRGLLDQAFYKQRTTRLKDT